MEIGPFWSQHGAEVDINTINSKSNSGSNETMQNVLALIVKILRIFEILTFRAFCVFHPIWIKFVVGGNIGQEQHRMC